ncbi:alcohol dehydrogenase [Glutamicibacter sp. V16R2B1]|uniref:alcohol dehydrogenase n=1 Tax=Glutamicibacter sp. V16R2B1 TaxID=2036207 RepID=UPI0010FF3D49|nr:alcohol dehydrogenase [Glutamicibacter sp. V16R2B1]TLK53250.1 zinc-binding dehydrogenase [Glutamicibacter sp. V16R2B1]
MKSYAAFEDLSIREVISEEKDLAPREVRLSITHCGVCHSDIHLREGHYDLGSRGKLELAKTGITYPMVLGHEIVGTVSAVGSEVTGVQPGDSRMVYPWLGCGKCATCLAGDENLCAYNTSIGLVRPGGYAEAITVPHEKYLLGHTGIDPRWAATLSCSGLTAYSAARKVLPLDPQALVVVIGVGGVGGMAVNILSALGHRNITAVDLNPENLKHAQAAGASNTLLLPGNGQRAEQQGELRGKARAVIDFVNNGTTAELGFDLLAKGGTQIMVGLFGGELVVPTAIMATKALNLRGSYVGSLGELKELVELAATGKIKPLRLSAGELSAPGVSAALQDLSEGKVTGRLVLEPVGA